MHVPASLYIINMVNQAAKVRQF